MNNSIGVKNGYIPHTCCGSVKMDTKLSYIFTDFFFEIILTFMKQLPSVPMEVRHLVIDLLV